eukprot:s2970_g20.t1
MSDGLTPPDEKSRRNRKRTAAFAQARQPFLQSAAADFKLSPFVIRCRNCSGECSFQKGKPEDSFEECLKAFHEHFEAVGQGAEVMEAEAAQAHSEAQQDSGMKRKHSPARAQECSFQKGKPEDSFEECLKAVGQGAEVMEARQGYSKVLLHAGLLDVVGHGSVISTFLKQLKQPFPTSPLGQYCAGSLSFRGPTRFRHEKEAFASARTGRPGSVALGSMTWGCRCRSNSICCTSCSIACTITIDMPITNLIRSGSRGPCRTTRHDQEGQSVVDACCLVLAGSRHCSMRRQAPDQPSKRLCLAKRPRVRYGWSSSVQAPSAKLVASGGKQSRYVAVKQVPFENHKTREITLLENIRHSCIGLLDSFLEKDENDTEMLCMVLEYMPQNLHQKIGGQPLSVPDVRCFSFQLLRALAHLDGFHIVLTDEPSCSALDCICQFVCRFANLFILCSFFVETLQDLEPLSCHVNQAIFARAGGEPRSSSSEQRATAQASMHSCKICKVFAKLEFLGGK